MNYFKSKNIVITGSGNGLGRELAIRLSCFANKLFLVDYDLDGLEVTKQKCSPDINLKIVVADLSDKTDTLTKMKEINQENVDIIFANAGIGGVNPGDSFSIENDKKILDVNYFGTVWSIVPFLNQMIKNKQGHIVAISSLAGLRGLPQAASYSASKSAQSSFMDSLRIDLKKYDIIVSTIYPGFIKTKMTNHDSFKMPFMVSVEDAAIKTLSAVSRKKKTFYFPRVMGLLALFNRVLPSSFYSFIMPIINPSKKIESKIF